MVLQTLLKTLIFFDKDEEYISIVKDGSVGKILSCPKKSSVLSTLQYLNVKYPNNLTFTYYLLSSINFKKYIVGSTIPYIYFKDYSKERINVSQLLNKSK